MMQVSVVLTLRKPRRVRQLLLVRQKRSDVDVPVGVGRFFDFVY